KLDMSALSMTSQRARDMVGTFDAGRPPTSEPRQSLRCPRDLAPLSSIRPKARLLETPYGRLDWDGRRSLVRFVPSEVPYRTTADIEAEGIAMQRVLDGLGKVRLLIDLRAVMLRNDQRFEAAIAGFRRRAEGSPQIMPKISRNTACSRTLRSKAVIRRT